MNLTVNRRENMLQFFDDDGCIRCPISVRGQLVQKRLHLFGQTPRRPEAEQIVELFLSTPPHRKLTKGLLKTRATMRIEELEP